MRSRALPYSRSSRWEPLRNYPLGPTALILVGGLLQTGLGWAFLLAGGLDCVVPIQARGANCYPPFEVVGFLFAALGLAAIVLSVVVGVFGRFEIPIGVAVVGLAAVGLLSVVVETSSENWTFVAVIQGVSALAGLVTIALGRYRSARRDSSSAG